MSDNHDQKAFSNPKHKKRVIEPLHKDIGTKPGTKGAEQAVDLIRNKIDQLYVGQHEAHEPDAQEEIAEVKTANNRSKHQQFMYQLSTSGKSLAEIQEAWHAYYVSLPDQEKHEVWQEFYTEHEKSNQKENAKVHPAQQAKLVEHHSTPKTKADSRSTADIKQQLVRRVQKRAKPKNPHFQSVLFGLGMGFVVLVIMLFSFFNERIIAPFITPSRTVSSTPIITDLNETAVGKDSKIIIPKINVEIPVVYDEPSIQEEKVQKALERGVLHYATTPNPGEKGNAVIFGHSSNNILNSGKYKFAFVLLSRLENGDTFMLEKDGKRYVYKVYEKKVVSPKEVSVISNTDKPATATLITCDPPGTSINRLVVIGEQISPSPAQNVASSAQTTAGAEPAELPSNSPSLWARMTGWF